MANHVTGSAKRWVAAIVAGIGVAAGTLTANLGTASASSDIGMKMKTPTTYIGGLINWETQPGKNGVTCTVTSSQAVAGDTGTTPAPVGYSTVTMTATGTTSVDGSGGQVFSDRVAGGQPFTVGRTDVLGLHLALDPGAPDPDDSAVVTLQLQSWGGALQTLSHLRIEDNMLLGDGPSVGGSVDSALYTISCATWSI